MPPPAAQQHLPREVARPFPFQPWMRWPPGSRQSPGQFPQQCRQCLTFLAFLTSDIRLFTDVSLTWHAAAGGLAAKKPVRRLKTNPRATKKQPGPCRLYQCPSEITPDRRRSRLPRGAAQLAAEPKPAGTGRLIPQFPPGAGAFRPARRAKPREIPWLASCPAFAAQSPTESESRALGWPKP